MALTAHLGASAGAGMPLELPVQEVVVWSGADTDRSLPWSCEGRQFPLLGSVDHLVTCLGLR